MTRVNDLYPLRISDLGSVNLNDGLNPMLDLTLVADREFVASFCSAPTENLPAILGGHPCAEAVSVFSFPDVRLKCSLHSNQSVALVLVIIYQFTKTLMQKQENLKNNLLSTL